MGPKAETTIIKNLDIGDGNGSDSQDLTAPSPGFEPGTVSLTGSRSTVELRRNISYPIKKSILFQYPFSFFKERCSLTFSNDFASI